MWACAALALRLRLPSAFEQTTLCERRQVGRQVRTTKSRRGCSRKPSAITVQDGSRNTEGDRKVATAFVSRPALGNATAGSDATLTLIRLPGSENACE